MRVGKDVARARTRIAGLTLGLLGFGPIAGQASDSEVDGTVWYDAEGEVAWVDGPASEPLPPPFVPEWRQRELERRAIEGYRSRGTGRYDRGGRHRTGFQHFHRVPRRIHHGTRAHHGQFHRAHRFHGRHSGRGFGVRMSVRF